ncbi:T. brucei spp.-specific protein [Trypanosoma brucei gambiense DAL972]|uniref:T. brucei spp.-specific protein n=1 Tax=Trypanosoma brucei gambiense (strain MHOM/CI/86/DAL972) TaxID=679716 RepID=C9ZNX7_TRYB9|nr:T. brucei spp.-specific protein [Trypanosoma brucei gambiense DAL972]CBH11105.1 T. brucei spp.-specific protein [Trypanosoma brucei gambiense DAL972]|eukprot:XP_011773392.1 T. brucei spp.-specific protein [Trypanosoma brucei gambiense DAL972]
MERKQKKTRSMYSFVVFFFSKKRKDFTAVLTSFLSFLLFCLLSFVPPTSQDVIKCIFTGEHHKKATEAWGTSAHINIHKHTHTHTKKKEAMKGKAKEGSERSCIKFAGLLVSVACLISCGME